MNSFFFNKEVGSTSYLCFFKDEEKVIYPEIKGSETGALTQKAERICQNIPTNQQLLFTPTELSKRRAKKTPFYSATEPVPSQNLFSRK